MNEYTSQEELVEEFDKFDIIIVGSDQVWNVEMTGLLLSIICRLS